MPMAARIRNQPSCLRRAFTVDIENGNECLFLGEPLAHRPADTAATAGHDSHFSRKTSHMHSSVV